LVEHLTQTQVEDYCRQQLRVAELLSVSDHLGECGACQQRIEYAMNGDATFFAMRSAVFDEAAEIPLMRAHLTAEQTAGYVDRNLSGEELQVVADHLTSCEQCALVVDDLQAFKKQSAPSLDHEYRPMPVVSQTESWWQRAVAFLSAPFSKSPALAFGGALALILLAVTGWLIWRTPQLSETKQEIVESPPAPTSPSSPPSLSQPAPVPLVAQLNDGEGQLTLDQEGKLSGADDLPPAYQSMLKDALTTRRIERSAQLKGLARPPSSLMSADKEKGEFSVIEPVGKVLLTNQPAFRWSQMEGATGYIVEVYDSKFNLVATSPQLTELSWAIPQSLSRGNVYAWQVKAIKDGEEFKAPRPPAPQARFRILDQSKVSELTKAKRTFASSHLTLGLLYAEAGLLNEAEQELRALLKANPNSEIARGLLRQIQALRR
jgi:anti-sigma factor RsiW